MCLRVRVCVAFHDCAWYFLVARVAQKSARLPHACVIAFVCNAPRTQFAWAQTARYSEHLNQSPVRFARTHIHIYFNNMDVQDSYQAQVNTTTIIAPSQTMDDRPIILNVGGTPFTTSRRTLLQLPDTYFTGLLSERWYAAGTSAGEPIFIDRDPSLFHHLLNYLRDYPGLCRGIMSLSANEMTRLKDECDFYGMSHLVVDVQKYKSERLWALLSNTPGIRDTSRKLLFDANSDGKSLEIFHEKCDGEGNIVVLAHLTNGSVIGAYTSVSITSDIDETRERDKTAFLFAYSDDRVVFASPFTSSDRMVRVGSNHYFQIGTNDFVLVVDRMLLCTTIKTPEVFSDDKGVAILNLSLDNVEVWKMEHDDDDEE